MGLVAYITAGDPSLDATEQFVLAAAEAGADVIELGVPSAIRWPTGPRFSAPANARCAPERRLPA